MRRANLSVHIEAKVLSDTEANFWGSILLLKIIFQFSNRTVTRFKSP